MLAASPKKRPPAWTRPYSQADIGMLMADCISNERPTSVDHTHLIATRIPVSLRVTAFLKKSPPVWMRRYSHWHAYGGLHSQRGPPVWSRLQPHMLMGRPSLQKYQQKTKAKTNKKKTLAWTVLSCHENHCIPACRLHLQRKAHQCEQSFTAVLTPVGI